MKVINRARSDTRREREKMIERREGKPVENGVTSAASQPELSS